MPVQSRSEIPPFAASAFFDKTYEEALALLEDSRAYLTAVVERPPETADRLASARHDLATTRLTSRIGHIMAWLLYQKALARGDSGPHGTPLKSPRTQADWPLLEADDGPDAELPPALVSLLGRSAGLYRRVKRLQVELERPACPVPPSVALFAELSEGWSVGEG